MVMVLTIPKNKHLRNRWRYDINWRFGMKLVFLNSQANTPKEQKVLEEESRIFGDIIQCDVEDGHRRLGYKILCGHIWSYQHCAGVRHVIQSDDSVIIDTDKMVNILLQDTETEWENLIACPTKTHRARVRQIITFTNINNPHCVI